MVKAIAISNGCRDDSKPYFVKSFTLWYKKDNKWEEYGQLQTGLDRDFGDVYRVVDLENKFVTNSVKLTINSHQVNAKKDKDGSFFLRFDVQVQAPPLVIDQGIENDEFKARKIVQAMNMSKEQIDALKQIKEKDLFEIYGQSKFK